MDKTNAPKESEDGDMDQVYKDGLRMRSKTQDEVDTEYIMKLQYAKFEDYSAVNFKEMLVFLGKTEEGIPVMGLFGLNFPRSAMRDKFFNYFITKMDTIADKTYVLIYFHCGVGSTKKGQIQFLNTIFYSLPKKYMLHLRAFYVVEPTWVLKCYVWWSKDGNQRDSLANRVTYTENVKELEKLCPEMKFQIPANILPLLYSKTELKALDLSTSAKPKKTMFGMKLEDYDTGPDGIPSIFVALTGFFDKRKDAFSTQFLFRVPPSRQEFLEFDATIAVEGFEAIERVKDPTLVAEYIKKLLGDLKEPLIPHEVCNHVKKFAKFEEDAKMKLALEVVQSLSKNKRDLLAFLMNFFRRFLANQSYTDMNSFALSRVIGPNFLKPEKPNTEILVEVEQQNDRNALVEYILIHSEIC